MKAKVVLLLLALLCLPGLINAQDSKLDSLDQFVQKAMKHFETPGLSIAIVKNDSVLYVKGFGVKEIGKNESVDANTLFGIGSISKSFTPLAIAMLIDEGKLNWDDRVVDYLPYFELYDPYVTNSFTIRDLLTHRSGLKRVSGGTLWYHSDLSREQIIRRLKHLEPVSEFRTTSAYQNTMFIVASKVVEAVINDSWDNFVRHRIFEPLGMRNTVISQAERERSTNISQPHIKNEKFEILSIEQEKLDNMAPAGSFYSSSNDMAKYMNFMLNNGIIDQDTLVSPEAFSEILSPQIHFPVFSKPIHNKFTSYGLGWWLTPKDGNTIIEHSGGIDGMGANLMMEKNNRIGIIVLSNQTYSSIPFAITFDVMGDLLNDEDYVAFSKALTNWYPEIDRIQLSRRKERFAARVENTDPSLSIEKYQGVFEDKMYGDISIELDGQSLKLNFSHTPLFSGALSHWHYDTFKIDWTDPRVPDGFLTFEFDSKGQVTGFTLDQPNLLDVDFSELDIKKKAPSR